MKKIRKIWGLIMILSLSMLVLGGCSSGDDQLYKAMEKTQNALSMEAETELKLNIQMDQMGEGETDPMVAMFTEMLKDLKINIDQKMVRNKDASKMQSFVRAGMEIPMMPLEMDVWTDIDMTGDQAKMMQITKMPPMLTAFAEGDMAGKEYMVSDLTEEEGMSSIQYRDLMEMSNKAQPEMMKNILEMDKEFDIIEKLDKREIDGEKLDMYKLSLDDKSFKAMLRKTGNSFIEDEDFIDIVKDYMEIMMAMDTSPQDPIEEKEMEDLMDDLENNLPEAKKEFNIFMDKLDGVKLLGEEGIVMTYGISKDGYIVHQEGTIALEIDEKEFAKLDPETPPLEGEGMKMSIKIDMLTSVKDIDNKEIKIEMPEVNEGNSIDANEQMEGLEGLDGMEEDLEIQ